MQWAVVDGVGDKSGRRYVSYKAFIALVGEVPFLAPIVPVMKKLERIISIMYQTNDKRA